MSLRSARRFSAMLTPNGIHLVEYRRSSRGLQILKYTSHPAQFRDAPEAIETLAGVVESEGGRGGRIAVAITGLGSCHQILSLPPGDREVLEPVVRRELRRFYPGTFEGSGQPLVDFVPMSSEPGRAGEPRDILATAIPEALLRRLFEELRAREVLLEHLTILPRIVERLYENFASSTGTCALLLLIPRAPLLGFFHEGKLRLFSEPPLADADPATAVADLLEHLRRGGIFLRQQFRGAALDRLLVGGPPAEVREIVEQAGIPAEPFASYSDSPGALAALGAALDADDEDSGFNLLPRELRPPSRSEATIRFASFVAAALLIVAGTWWTAGAIGREAQAAAQAQQMERRVAATEAEFDRIRPVLEEREAHADRTAFLEALVASRADLAETFWALDAAGPNIRPVELRLSREGPGWTGTLRARAEGLSGAGASGAARELVRQLDAVLASTEVRLTDFAIVDADESQVLSGGRAIAVDFEISFIVATSGTP